MLGHPPSSHMQLALVGYHAGVYTGEALDADSEVFKGSFWCAKLDYDSELRLTG